jgi:hypothetical protein
MSDMTDDDDTDWLTALSDADIDYSSLSERQLMRLSQGTEPYIATSAMHELGARRSPEAAAIALAVLDAPASDAYLRAAALGVLSDVDLDAARLRMESLVDAEPYLPNALMERMLEDADYYRSANGVTVTTAVKMRLSTLAKHATQPRADVVQLFGEQFGAP